ncbi:peptidoglycan-binding domain-containing protein [Nocardiopsis metallicus]|nr:peptidoglycan-binding domain-containing protein [Nocardiopsis metallicus]
MDLAGYGIIGHQSVEGIDTACPGSLQSYVQDGTLNPPDTLPPTDPLPVVPPVDPPGPPPGGGAPTWPGVLFTNPPPTEHDGVILWQGRMLERGWNITVDGIYGDHSQQVCEQFQAEKGLAVDGIVGPPDLGRHLGSPHHLMDFP